MTRALSLGSVLVLTLGWSCASVPPADPAVGCYQFERNAWARTLGLPWGLVLEDAGLGTGWPLLADRTDVRRAATATSPTQRADHPLGYWAPAAGDSIEVGHPGGGGLVLTLARSGRDLIGRGVAAGDAVPLGGASGPRAPVTVVARRVLCDAS
ncbi:MAG: hypothetical protein EXR95_10935 [Gemmatimonadetes bacterium]|nr:hypothetical protein [Gemmatimonadota bacterium]